MPKARRRSATVTQEQLVEIAKTKFEGPERTATLSMRLASLPAPPEAWVSSSKSDPVGRLDLRDSCGEPRGRRCKKGARFELLGVASPRGRRHNTRFAEKVGRRLSRWRHVPALPRELDHAGSIPLRLGPWRRLSGETAVSKQRSRS